MKLWLSLLVSTGLLTTCTVANPMPGLAKREAGRRCSSRESCVTWYTTGSAQCSSGYEPSHYEADKSPLGTYCEKKCSDDDWNQCASDQCQFNLRECRLYPGNKICAKALNYCGSPLAVPERSCTKEAMGREVLWDAEQKTCALDPSPGPGAERHLVLNLYTKGGKTYQDYFPADAKRLHLDCGPTTEHSAREMWKTFAQSIKTKNIQDLKIRYCKGGNPDYSKPKPTYNCMSPEANWEDVKARFQRACDTGSPINGLKPVMTTSD
ncbi:hypothetical protein N7492_008939 [Penicillium capsulatum]|uniref:Uncharacterized protein n=1 Tax=Penicillium capsulatum TaxID=69766 RepID=A0A9W9HRL2_9EURO|nr:hypothetical protein N7492_008939 [Penicillium capsulatum]KAJ6106340.1 hypothetical protein N7512_009857 [Penicillium capsulatum]